MAVNQLFVMGDQKKTEQIGAVDVTLGRAPVAPCLFAIAASQSWLSSSPSCASTASTSFCVGQYFLPPSGGRSPSCEAGVAGPIWASAKLPWLLLLCNSSSAGPAELSTRGADRRCKKEAMAWGHALPLAAAGK